MEGLYKAIIITSLLIGVAVIPYYIRRLVKRREALKRLDQYKVRLKELREEIETGNADFLTQPIISMINLNVKLLALEHRIHLPHWAENVPSQKGAFK